MQGSSGNMVRKGFSPGALAALLICLLVVVIGGFTLLGLYFLKFTSSLASELLIRTEVGQDMLRLVSGDPISDGPISKQKGPLIEVGNAAREMMREISEIQADLYLRYDEVLEHNVYLYKTLEDEKKFRMGIAAEKAYCELLAKIYERIANAIQLHSKLLMQASKGDPKASQIVRDINYAFSLFLSDGMAMSKYATEMSVVNIALAEFVWQNRKWTKPNADGYIEFVEQTPPSIRSKYLELKSRSDSAIDSFSDLRDRAWERLETKAKEMMATLNSDEDA